MLLLNQEFRVYFQKLPARVQWHVVFSACGNIAPKTSRNLALALCGPSLKKKSVLAGHGTSAEPSEGLWLVCNSLITGPASWIAAASGQESWLCHFLVKYIAPQLSISCTTKTPGKLFRSWFSQFIRIPVLVSHLPVCKLTPSNPTTAGRDLKESLSEILTSTVGFSFYPRTSPLRDPTANNPTPSSLSREMP